jgi:hypothetical protein
MDFDEAVRAVGRLEGQAVSVTVWGVEGERGGMLVSLTGSLLSVPPFDPDGGNRPQPTATVFAYLSRIQLRQSERRLVLASRVRRRLIHDNDRAGRVLNDLLADRSEEEALEAAEAASADDDQRRVGALLEQHIRRVSLYRQRFSF